MKKTTSIFNVALAIFMMVSTGLFAKGEKDQRNMVEIGTGTDLTSSLPVTTNYGYSVSQTLLMQDEINVTGQRITKIAFHYNGYEEWTDNVKIYMKETDETSLVAFDTTGQTLVYDGKLQASSLDMWHEMALNTPFTYSNTKNLKITFIEESSGFHASSSKYYCTSTTETMALESHRDYPEYTFETLEDETATPVAHRANIRVFTEEDIAGAAYSFEPTQLFFDVIEATTSGTLNATILNTGDVSLEVTGVEVTGDQVFSCSFTGTLEPGEEASFPVNFSPAEAGDFSASLTFQTNSTISTDPLQAYGSAFPFGVLKEDFEDTTFPPEGWTLQETSWKRKGFGGYESRGNAYRTEDASAGYLITPMVKIESDSKISFYAKRFGMEGGNLEVSVSEDLVTWYVVSLFELTTAYTNYDIDLGSFVGNKYIGFSGTPTMNLDYVRGPVVWTGGNPPAPATNPAPADAATDEFVNLWLQWEGNVESQGYKICLGTDNPPTNILDMVDMGSATQYKAEALAFGTTFYWSVTPYNEDGDAVDCPVWSFTTQESAVITEFPYVVDFEECDEEIPENWKNIGSKWQVIPWAFLGEKAAVSYYMHDDGDAELYSPVIETGDEMELVFAWKNSYTASKLDNHDTIFVDIAEVNGVGTWENLAYVNSDEEMEMFELNKFDLADYAGKQIIIRFRHVSDNAVKAGNAYLDNIIIRNKETEPIAFLNYHDWDAGVIAKDTWVGSGDTIWISNMGADGMNIESIEFSGDQFTTTLASEITDMPFGQIVPFVVYFEPNKPGINTEQMTINTNSNNPVFNVKGEAYDVPDFTSEGFEGSSYPPMGWMGHDADNDEIQWMIGYESTIKSHSGYHCALSFSYVDGLGPLTPDDWMVTPKIHVDGEKELSFWVATTWANTPEEHLEVYIAEGNSHLENFTEKVFEYTTVKADTNYRQVFLDLRSYQDKDIYVAFVHNNSTDNYGIQIDDVELQEYQANHAPVITNFPLMTAINGMFFEDFITCVDPDRDDLEYSLTEKPEWLDIVPVAGTNRARLSGIPTQRGVYDVTVAITDGTDNIDQSYQILVHEDGEYIIEEFEDEEWPNNGWKTYDEDGDTYNWFYANNDAHNAGYNSPACAGSESWKFVIKFGAKEPGKGALLPDNWMVSPVMLVKEDSYLSWFSSAYDKKNVNEHYAVYISTTGDEPADFTTPVYEQTISSTNWQQHLVDLSDYAGQSIWVAFRHFDVTDQYVVLIDDVMMPTYNVGMDEDDEAHFVMYPNPTSGAVNLNGMDFEIVEVININGKVVKKVTGGATQLTLDVSHLPKGLYMVRVQEGQEVYSRKLQLF